MNQSETPRPLKAIGRALSAWARRGNCQTTVAHSGRVRAAADHAGIAMQWMGKGYQYDQRTWRERLCAGNFYWRAAARALFGDPR